MKNLKNHYSAILEACRNCAEVGYEDDPISNGECYEVDDVRIELSFTASGRFTEDGDGYWTPLQTVVSNVRVYVDEIEGSYIINDDGDEEEIPQSELNDLAAYLEKELPSLLED